MILNAWFAGRSPGAELTFYWGSKMADQEGSRNYPGIKSEAIDFLCKYIAAAKKREDLVTGSHALDRLLMWGHYVIPLFYNNRLFVAHASKLAYPEIDPNRSISLATWWSKETKTK
jgi:ABC-type oligopeptide transport system substrate-binding subunit